MYVFEKWKHASSSTYIKKVNKAINIPNLKIEKLEQILEEMRKNI